jgi:hypothetical protein
MIDRSDIRVRRMDDKGVLERFVVDNPELERLEALADEYNIFEAIGMVSQEIRHSVFLAFLLDPSQTHGLGDLFLRRFLQKVLLAARGAKLPVSLIDLDVWSLDDTLVLREWHNIDILAVNRTNRFVVIIENKVESGEHSDQLARYYQTAQREYDAWRVIALYLTPDGTPPSDDRYIAVSYRSVADQVEWMLTNRSGSMAPDVRVLLAHYVQMLRRRILSDSEIDDLCLRIYQKHKRALDLIFERRPDLQSDLSTVCRELVEAQGDLILDHATKSRIRFAVPEWDVPELMRGQGWTPSGRMLLFEFINDPGTFRIALHIGPGPSDVRQRVYEVAAQSQSLLKPASRNIAGKWNLIYNKPILSGQALALDDRGQILLAIRTAWDRFLTHDLVEIKRILQPLVDELRGVPSNGS